MKHLFYFVLLSLFCFPLQSSSMGTPQESHENFWQPEIEGRAYLLLDKELRPTQALSQLLEATGISPQLDFPSIIKETQRHWIKNEERWKAAETHGHLREKLIPILDELGCLKEVTPSKTYYDYAIVYGALVNSLRPKMKRVVNLWNQGIRFKKLIFLCADWSPDLDRELPRLLNSYDSDYPMKANWVLPNPVPQTEYDLAQSLFDQTEIPESMKDLEVIFTKTPMIALEDGTLKRPSSLDTIHHWLSEEKPTPGSCLFFSGQPHVGYQDTIARMGLPSSFTIETVGYQYNENLFMSVHLDCIARWLYSEGKRHGAF